MDGTIFKQLTEHEVVKIAGFMSSAFRAAKRSGKGPSQGYSMDQMMSARVQEIAKRHKAKGITVGDVAASRSPISREAA